MGGLAGGYMNCPIPGGSKKKTEATAGTRSSAVSQDSDILLMEAIRPQGLNGFPRGIPRGQM